MIPMSSVPPAPDPAESVRSAPRWARLLDVLALALLAVAVIVALTGGFRLRVAGVRIAASSPLAVAAWALGIAILRHLLNRDVPIYRDLPRRCRAWWSAPGVRDALTIVVGTRFAVLFAGYLAIFMFGFANGRVPWRLVDNEFHNLQVRWDAGWYLNIAIDGYAFIPDRPDQQQNIVFFPAFPLVTRVVGRLLGGSSPAFAWGGTAVAIGAFFVALVYLYRLGRDLLGRDEDAVDALWLLAAYPFALFYGAVYTESLFLCGTVAAFYYASRHQPVKAGLWGLLVGLTRPNGCFLALPLGLMACEPWLPAWLRPPVRPAAAPRGSGPAGAEPERAVAALLAASMPVVGVLLYSAFMWRFTGHPLQWAEGHLAWGRQYTGLMGLVERPYALVSQGGMYTYVAEVPADFLNAIGALFALGAAWPVFRRFGPAYASFLLVNLVPPLAAGGVLSAGRLSSVLFPAFLWLGSAVPKRQRPAWLGSFMAVQAFNAALFYTWRPLF
jgi:hypothetical protein